MEIYTIGFTKKSAEEFFGILKRMGIRRLVDVRLRNNSQLAGFAKLPDLPYFLDKILCASYVHETLLAPTDELLNGFKKLKSFTWEMYVESYVALLKEREVEKKLNPGDFAKSSVLLCSEETAEHCHRRLAVEYLRDCWGGVSIIHL